MKKNVMMRIASILMVATLLTTCVISGTFAKYVTSASGSDTARVAKFGVKLSVAGDSMFSNEYDTDDTTYDGSITVKSIDDANVVAPGTASADGAAFAITGTPEVATKITVALENVEDIFLAAGTYTDWTIAPYGVDDEATEDVTEGEFTLEENYYPVVYTLKQGDTVIATGNLEAIEDAIDTFNATATYAPNTELDAAFSLTWAWAFEQTDATLYNKADTLLGNLAADATEFGADLTAGTDYNLTLAYDLTVTVTQID